jgi:predicted chitinase
VAAPLCADQDDVVLATERVDGGDNGLADRRRRLAHMKFVLRAP